jgi:hypothetical protein
MVLLGFLIYQVVLVLYTCALSLLFLFFLLVCFVTEATTLPSSFHI